MTPVSRRAVADYTFSILTFAAIGGVVYCLYRATGLVIYFAGGGGW